MGDTESTTTITPVLPDVKDILSNADCDTLRRMRPAGDIASAIKQLYPDAQGFVKAVEDANNGPCRLDDSQQEIAVLSAMIASEAHESLVAIHIYLAIMANVPIYPAQIANTLMIAGMYSGIQKFTRGLAILHNTLNVLKRRIKANDVNPANIFRELAAPLLKINI